MAMISYWTLKRLNPDLIQIQSMLAERGSVSLYDLKMELMLSDSSARRRMNLLVDEGQAVKIRPGTWAAAARRQELERKAKA
jgi:DeoR/GlpR family transcriptional regulator of sugar metabolism